MQRGLAAIKIDNGCLDPLLGERIESLLEQLPVAGNRVVKLVARIAHALTALIIGGSTWALSVTGNCRPVDDGTNSRERRKFKPAADKFARQGAFGELSAELSVSNR